MQAGFFACILSAVMEKQTGGVRKTTSKQCKQVPGKWLNKLGGGGAKPKSGRSQQRYRDTLSSLRRCSG